jgi:hypothetical protein
MIENSEKILLNAFLVSPIRVIRATHLILLDLVALMTSEEEDKFLSSWLCSHKAEEVTE